MNEVMIIMIMMIMTTMVCKLLVMTSYIRGITHLHCFPCLTVHPGIFKASSLATQHLSTSRHSSGLPQSQSSPSSTILFPQYEPLLWAVKGSTCCKLVLRLLSNELTRQTQRSKVLNIQQVLQVDSRGRSSVLRPIKGQGTPNRGRVPTGLTILQLQICSESDREDG